MEDGDGAETRSVSMRDSEGPPITVHMLQWVLNGVEEAVHAITVRRIHNSALFSRPNGNGGRGIEDFFSGLSNLQSLNLSGALKGLSMDTDPQLQHCLIALPQLQALDLSRNGLVGANICALHDAWAQLTRLRSLNLGFNTLRTDAAQSVTYALSNVSKLTYLSLADSSLFYGGGGGSDDYDAEFGEGFSVDSDLRESCCLLSFALGNLVELKALDMSYSEFTDTGGLSAFASALVSSTALEHLSLDKLRTDTGYERTGAQVLFPALRSMTGLQHLSWVKCPGDSYNDEYCHFASSLEGLKGLRCLDLSKGHLWNQRSPLSIALQTLTDLEYLNVSKTNIHYTEENEEDCYHDYGHQDLQAVTEVSAFYPALGMLISLRGLNISGNTFRHEDNRSCDAFSSSIMGLGRTLQHLNVSSCYMAHHLRTVSTINTLALALAGLKRLLSLDISNNKITGVEMKSLGPSLACLPALKSLNLSFNPLLDYDGIMPLSAALIKLTGLTYLDMSEVPCSNTELDHLRLMSCALAALQNLVHLDLRGSSVFLCEPSASVVLLPALTQLSALTKLVVSNFEVSDGSDDSEGWEDYNEDSDDSSSSRKQRRTELALSRSFVVGRIDIGRQSYSALGRGLVRPAIVNDALKQAISHMPSCQLVFNSYN